MAFPEQVQRRIIRDNLHMQETEIARALEARRSHLADAVKLLLPYIRDESITLSFLAKIGSDAFLSGEEPVTLHREVLGENAAAIETALSSLVAYDRCVFVTQLVSRASCAGHPITTDLFFAPATASHRIAYVRNAYTDEAFDAFSMSFSAPTSLFTESYEEACAEVSDGTCGYCILPYRDTSGAYHRATRNLLDMHDLMVVSIVTVTDGEDVPMQYALVGRTPICSPASWEMTVEMPSEWDTRLAELSQATAHFGHTICGIHKEVAGRELLLTLRGDTEPIALLTWLNIVAPAARIKGFYSTTEDTI